LRGNISTTRQLAYAFFERASLAPFLAIQSETQAPTGGQMTTLNINGKQHDVNVPGDTPLLWVLRDEIGLTGTKFGCGMALCGACTVHIDGQPGRACVTPISSIGAKKIVTIEAMSADKVGRAVQAAWIDVGVPQCGYCQAGQVMSATALLKKNPKPTDAHIDDAMTGNICRCGTYGRIRAAIKQAAGMNGGEA
jgi:isoquinoline 1-oxidoreductase alpha subunit